MAQTKQYVNLTTLCGMPAVEIRFADAVACILLQGAQLMWFEKAGGPSVIWRNPDAAFEPGTATRGGIPICWPWYAAPAWNADEVMQEWKLDDASPFHGLVRTIPWQIIDAQQTNTYSSVTLRAPRLTDTQNINLEISFTLGHKLRIELVTSNESTSSIHINEALHTYFAISDIHAIQIPNQRNLSYLDMLDNPQKTRGPWQFHPGAEFTACLQHIDHPLTIIDEGWQRAISIETLGCKSAVVWNPGPVRAKNLDQFSPTSWKTMICLESGNLMNNFVKIKPTQKHKLITSISVTPL
ncbi:D-hexose-6-phosphate mutarotase [Pseudomonas putida]|uniref:D-hexose-6-phosphate mutarotase n=1 Tax=Pseudomonas putida TaxID=303 RepID=UPI002363F375|nr:hypothetical protein [Pseudomonas putida]MDD2002081.1 hypothetical protein [Pseudomonas putida]